MQVNVIHEYTQADWKECGIDKILWHEWFYWSVSHWVTLFHFAMSSLVFQYELGLDICKFILCEERVDQRVDWHAKVKSEIQIEIMKLKSQFTHTQSHCYYPSGLESFYWRWEQRLLTSCQVNILFTLTLVFTGTVTPAPTFQGVMDFSYCYSFRCLLLLTRATLYQRSYRIVEEYPNGHER